MKFQNACILNQNLQDESLLKIAILLKGLTSTSLKEFLAVKLHESFQRLTAGLRNFWLNFQYDLQILSRIKTENNQEIPILK